jgi:hypothetical protein
VGLIRVRYTKPRAAAPFCVSSPTRFEAWPENSAFTAALRDSLATWAEAFEEFGIPKGQTGPAEEMFEAVNAGWMDLGVEGTEHVAGTTSARDVFEAALNAA